MGLPIPSKDTYVYAYNVLYISTQIPKYMCITFCINSFELTYIIRQKFTICLSNTTIRQDSKIFCTPSKPTNLQTSSVIFSLLTISPTVEIISFAVCVLV